MKKRTLILAVILFASFNLSAQLSKAELKKIDETVQRAFTSFQPVGLSIAIVKDGAIIYKNALGVADNTTGEKLTTAHDFNIASCSKAFTAACIGLLVQEGKLNWSDKVVDILPEFRLADPWITKELTITDLLCHRSGLKTFEGDLLWYETNYPDSLIMAHMRYLPIVQDFRSSFGYQNLMYMVAGEVIRKVSGKDWEVFVQERLLGPLGMIHSKSTFNQLERDQPVAMPHFDAKRIPITLFNSVKPAGAIFSNVEDLALWASMLMNDGQVGDKEILKSSTIRQLFTSRTLLPVSSMNQQNGIHFRSYGLGWFMFDIGGRKIIEHDGGMPGYISKVMLVPEDKIAILILNNGQDGLVNDALKFQLLVEFLKLPAKDWISEYANYKKLNEEGDTKEANERLAKRILGTQPSLPLQSYCGIFNDNSYGKAEVDEQEGQLKLTFLPASEVMTGSLEHWHYNTFKVKFKDETLNYGLVTFDFNSSGEVTGFKIDLPSGDFHFNDLDFRKLP
jgi:CubicO group peptidase (beta-lactamase class C family)